MTRFKQALLQKNLGRPPVWFMRQAGRYHSHYQKIKSKYSFVEICTKPEVAAEATLGPIEDFGFDAAILFSDLLFPLQVMGMGLTYPEGPHLDKQLRSLDDIRSLRTGNVNDLLFQQRALEILRRKLPRETGLLGFVGSPLTLFYFAVEGTHKNAPQDVEKAFSDGRWNAFCEILYPILLDNMLLQSDVDIDALAIFDTCAGEISPDNYGEFVIPVLRRLFSDFKARKPDVSLIYYSKGTSSSQWQNLNDFKFDCLGIDWHQSLAKALTQQGQKWSIQGNLDPNHLLLHETEMVRHAQEFFFQIKKLDRQLLKGWIFGLGHGVLPKTPESNVRRLLSIFREEFR